MLRLLQCLEFREIQRARKERHAVFVYSCLACPQGAFSERKPADERAGGGLQRLDQLAVSAVPPLRAV